MEVKLKEALHASSNRRSRGKTLQRLVDPHGIVEEMYWVTNRLFSFLNSNTSSHDFLGTFTESLVEIEGTQGGDPTVYSVGVWRVDWLNRLAIHRDRAVVGLRDHRGALRLKYVVVVMLAAVLMTVLLAGLVAILVAVMMVVVLPVLMSIRLGGRWWERDLGRWCRCLCRPTRRMSHWWHWQGLHVYRTQRRSAEGGTILKTRYGGYTVVSSHRSGGSVGATLVKDGTEF